MIKVCDAIMGSGKSQSAIAYINSHPHEKFIYISPYNDEATRIVQGCPNHHFAVPIEKIPEYNYTKTGHACKLIAEGRNIASTHAALKYYTHDMLEQIQTTGYTLIIDENLSAIDDFKFHPNDLTVMVDAGYIVEDGNFLRLARHDYTGKAHAEMMRLMKSRTLFRHKTPEGKDAVYFWSLPTDLLNAFKDVFILTYLFEGQDMANYFKMNHMEYEYIGVRRTEDGGYEFSDDESYLPEYCATLSSRIHICSHKKLNAIGEKKTALSMGWFKRKSDDVVQLNRNIYNYFHNIIGEKHSAGRLWATYKNAESKLRRAGYYWKCIPLNSRATNEYHDRYVLVYAVNLFMNVDQRHFLEANGIKPDDDLYALSVMIQWIWRSAIRDGKDIYIYLPSSRMRNLLVKWIAEVEEQYRQKYGSDEVLAEAC